MEKIFLSILLVLFLSSACFAETITLKSGQTVEGKVIEKTDKYIKIDFQGVPLTYFLDEIKSIDMEKLPSNRETALKDVISSSAIENQIRDMIGEYIEALKNHDVEKYKKLISSQSIKAGEGGVTPYMMDNQYNPIYNNAYTIRLSRDRTEALLTFKDSRNGTANPYIVIYENGTWKVDLTQMWQRIRFGPGNKWYWVDQWNK